MLKITDYECNELDMAKLFVELNGTKIRSDIEERNFYIWKDENGIWHISNYEEINNMIEEFIMVTLPDLAKEIEDENERAKYMDYINKQNSNSAIERIFKGVKRNKMIRATKKDFDSMGRYFNCLNAVFDIEELKGIKHSKELMLSKQSGVNINKYVADKTWRDFIMDIMDNDEEMYTYILRMIGYAMQGTSQDDCMFMLYGESSRNGKSTLVNGLLKFFGDYAITMNPETISKCFRTGGVARPDLVRLQGKRFVNVAEADMRQKLDVAMVKSLTGGDIITARKMYQDPEEFINQGVFFFHTNHLPLVDDSTIFKSQRVIVVPFNVRFTDDNIDTNMEKKLTTPEALSGLFLEVFNTLKEYNMMSIKEELPEKVIRATKEFEYNSDFMKQFLEQFTIKDSWEMASSTELYNKFRAWSKVNDIDYLTHKAFSLIMKKKGYKIKHQNHGNYFIGLKIK